MAKPYPTDNMYLQNNFAPVRMECDANDLVIEGDMPKELHGVLYRNTANPQYAPWSETHHWFLGDGMVHAFFIEGGKVSYKNRWVRTQKFDHERKLGESVVATNFEDIMNQDPRAEGISMNVANTNVMVHGGKLLAMDEASPHFVMDPSTLDSVGPTTYGDVYDGPMTAHPKLDPETGELISFGPMAGGPGSCEVGYNVIDANGKMTVNDIITAPYAAMTHDFLASSTHVLMPVMPASIDFERIMEGGPFVAWEPDRGNHIGIFDRRDGPASTRWFTNEASYVFHTLNMYQEGSKIIADVMRFEKLPLFDAPGETTDPTSIDNNLFRWTFDLEGNSNTYKEEQLDDFMGEFPRLDERFTGKKHKYGFFAARRLEINDTEGPFDTILAKNFETGQNDEWTPGDGIYIQEPVFVPRSADAPQGDGWILTLTWDRRDNLSDLVVLNAQDVASGPIARAKLPTRVPYGFHGNWHSLS